jgi:fructosamine-3-kinase
MLWLLDHLDRYLAEPEYPSLLHGDLWGGNFMTGPDGYAWLIDPAVYVGHREADLAMTELFGGFAPAFYSAYRQIANVDPEYDDRRDLYNLYHLLNHVNLFGYSYVGSVLRTLDRFGG